MGRKIILLSDGTGNSSAQVWRTNVWRVFERLDLSNDGQVVIYDDGVGTAAFKPFAILGGAFGFGLKRNVIEIYKFACRNYRDVDDEIFGFGFSRGAFTMRVVVGMILEQGLVQENDEAKLHALAEDAYREFRANNFHTSWWRPLRPEAWIRALRSLLVPSRYDQKRNRHDITVRFLGLWDTVAAYGMPIDEMTRGISYWLWPWMLPDCVLNPRVKRACHALSVDDERTTFHPTLWDERGVAPLTPRQDGKYYLVDEQVSQVWFLGMHANVGGGYPDDSVAHIALTWILIEAQNCGLTFKNSWEASPQTFQQPQTIQDKDGRIYDPRSGIGGYYRYGPRDIARLGGALLARGHNAPQFKIHESVLKRICNRAHAYAPRGLPRDYWVTTRSGNVLPPDQNPYETHEQAQRRFNLQEHVWNTIWLRRIVYFLAVGVSICLFVFPLFYPALATRELESSFRWVSNIVRAIGSFLPPAATPWLDGYARRPEQFLLLLVLLFLITRWSSALSSTIQAQLGDIWQASVSGSLPPNSLPNDPVYRFRTHPWYHKTHSVLRKGIAPAFFAALFFYLGLSIVNRIAFNIQDYARLVCKRSPGTLAGLRSGEVLLAEGKTAALSPQHTASPFANIPNLPVFETKDPCRSMNLVVERGKPYLIRLESTASFKDFQISASEGFDSLQAPHLWKVVMTSAVPLRRQLMQPWFRIVVRYGDKGGEEQFLLPDRTDQWQINTVIRPTRSGELFLYVNDTVIGIPGLYGLFYENNKGSTKVFMQRH